MKLVKYTANERVDLPDMSAMSALPLGEFRRTIRGLLTGADEMSIINGFEVEANFPVTSAIVVKLDPGGGVWLSHALLAEGLNFGQLAGGQDDQQATEGNATFPVDFAGQPAATYTVEMRFTYADGDTQNRAFINPTTKVESVATAQTREVPTLEVRLIGAATGGEWLPLATVVWNGATISSGDITDLRVHALEGGPAFQASVWGGAGGVADFPRNAARSNPANGLFALFPFVRGLARQIQDIKGFSDSGYLDLFSRARSVPRAGTGTVPAEQTRSLASMDMEELTVGDGSTTFGDFNGSNGLQLCLDHIALNKATLFKHVVVKVKTRSNNGGAVSQTLATPVDLTGIRVTIDCVTGNLAAGRLLVDFTHGAGAFFTSTTREYPLEIRNMESSPPTGGKTVYPLFDGANANAIVLHNCDFRVSRTLALPIITAEASATRITRSVIYGEVRLGGGRADRPAVFDGIEGNTNAATDAAPTVIRLYQTLGVSGETSQNVTIKRSVLYQVDGRGASEVEVNKCSIVHGHADGIMLGRSAAISSRNWLIKDCQVTGAAQSVAGHATTNGAKGTGWSVHCIDSAAASGAKCRNIVVSGLVPTVLSGTDSGIVRLENVSVGIVEQIHLNGLDLGGTAVLHHGVEVSESDRVTIRSNSWEGCAGGAATLDYRCVSLADTNTGHRVVDNVFDGPTGLGSTTSVFHVKASGDGSANLRDVKVLRNRFLDINDNGAAFAGSAHVSVGQAAPTFSSVRNFEVSDNLFSEASTKYCVFFFNGISTLYDTRIDRNTKTAEGDFVGIDSTALGVSVSHNRFEPGTGTNNVFLAMTRTGMARIHIANNHFVATNALSGLITLTGANGPLQLVNNTLDGLTNNVLMSTGTTDEITVIGNFSTTATAQIISGTPPTNHTGWGNTTLNRFVFV